MSHPPVLSYKMSTWSRSAVYSPSGLYSPPGLSSPSGLYSPSGHKHPSVIVSDKSFPTLGGGDGSTNVSAGPPSKKPVLNFAQKVKQTADAEAAAAAACAAAKKAESDRIAAQRLTEEADRRHVSLVSNFYKKRRTTDEDYAREDSSPDEMDYETALEYEEHLRYNRRERLRVTDYSKDLSSEEEEEQDI
jgi:hypothetical protein